jgi:hypothetical protein
MKPTRQICDAFMRAIKEGSIPFGYYGPETCRWATPEEMRRFGLEYCSRRVNSTGTPSMLWQNGGDANAKDWI